MPIPHTYRVIGKIGAGNSGEIYKAYQINLGKYVVLKKIKTEVRSGRKRTNVHCSWLFR